jgi:hypothetical protein
MAKRNIHLGDTILGNSQIVFILKIKHRAVYEVIQWHVFSPSSALKNGKYKICLFGEQTPGKSCLFLMTICRKVK